MNEELSGSIRLLRESDDYFHTPRAIAAQITLMKNAAMMRMDVIRSHAGARGSPLSSSCVICFRNFELSTRGNGSKKKPPDLEGGGW